VTSLEAGQSLEVGEGSLAEVVTGQLMEEEVVVLALVRERRARQHELLPARLTTLQSAKSKVGAEAEEEIEAQAMAMDAQERLTVEVEVAPQVKRTVAAAVEEEQMA
jgi:hypothetical protein